MTKRINTYRILAVLLVMAISLCCFVLPVKAEDTIIDNKLLNIDTDNTYRLEDYEDAVVISDLINDLSGENHIATLSAEDNTAPVAGLTLMLVNPESLVNNKVSTDSVIFWLWKDGDEYLTYDPDGNGEIAEFHIEGINEFITGYVTLGDETVGFATQITVAAEHFLKYYVVDTYGSSSNVLNYRIEVEPSDGNQRPECAISASNTTAFAGEKVYFDCAPSTDPDNDAIVSIKIKLVLENKQEISATDSPYFLGASGTEVTMKFDEIGTYGVRFAVQDSRGAWSNWVGGDFVVTERGSEDKIISLGVDWTDDKTVKWTSDNTTNSHTMNSKLSTVMVYANQRRSVRSYTNRKGTYRNVIAYPVAPGTHFSCADTLWVPHSGMERDYTDPFFGLETPRTLTAEEITEIQNSSRWKNHIYIIYDANRGEIIDFYSPLNIIIGKFWDEPTLVLYD